MQLPDGRILCVLFLFVLRGKARIPHRVQPALCQHANVITFVRYRFATSFISGQPFLKVPGDFSKDTASAPSAGTALGTSFAFYLESSFVLDTLFDVAQRRKLRAAEVVCVAPGPRFSSLPGRLPPRHLDLRGPCVLSMVF